MVSTDRSIIIDAIKRISGPVEGFVSRSGNDREVVAFMEKLAVDVIRRKYGVTLQHVKETWIAIGGQDANSATINKLVVAIGAALSKSSVPAISRREQARLDTVEDWRSSSHLV